MLAPTRLKRADSAIGQNVFAVALQYRQLVMNPLALSPVSAIGGIVTAANPKEFTGRFVENARPGVARVSIVASRQNDVL